MNNLIDIQAKYCSKEFDPYSFPTQKIFIDSDLTQELLNFMSSYHKPLFVCDKYTLPIAKKIAKKDDLFLFPGRVIPTVRNAISLMKKSSEHDLIVAVGSGAILDICKLVTFWKKISLASYATAPSMNGYCSPTSSIIDYDHIKRSRLTKMPDVLFMDLDIISNAPLRLIKSGLGDLLCRSTCYADYYLANQITGEHSLELPFSWLKKSEEELLNKINSILRRDVDAIKTLCEVLVVSGIAMYHAGGSYPASQGEHMLAHHYHELSDGIVKSYHGEEIAVTTLIMKRLQDFCLSEGFCVDRSWDERDVKTLPYFARKDAIYEKIKKNEEVIKTTWQKLKDHIVSHTLQYEVIEEVLSEIGLPKTSHELGWSKNLFRKAIKQAAYTRERFTFLDVANINSSLAKFCNKDIIRNIF